jgi:Tfp pilus assembly protein PilN
MTNQDLAAQNVNIELLRNEFARLDSLFEKNLKALGLTEADLKNTDLNNAPPEVKALLQKAQQEAKEAGARRAREVPNIEVKKSGGATPRRGQAMSV